MVDATNAPTPTDCKINLRSSLFDSEGIECTYYLPSKIVNCTQKSWNFKLESIYLNHFKKLQIKFCEERIIFVGRSLKTNWELFRKVLKIDFESLGVHVTAAKTCFVLFIPV